MLTGTAANTGNGGEHRTRRTSSYRRISKYRRTVVKATRFILDQLVLVRIQVRLLYIFLQTS